MSLESLHERVTRIGAALHHLSDGLLVRPHWRSDEERRGHLRATLELLASEVEHVTGDIERLMWQREAPEATTAEPMAEVERLRKLVAGLDELEADHAQRAALIRRKLAAAEEQISPAPAAAEVRQ